MDGIVVCKRDTSRKSEEKRDRKERVREKDTVELELTWGLSSKVGIGESS